jgi:hypothetical protein
VSWRATVWQALEALEVGDSAGAVELLLAAVEDGDPTPAWTASSTVPGVALRWACPVCGAGHAWPGVLDSHLLIAHGTVR